MIAVGSSPVLLVTTFLGVLCIWLMYVSFQSIRILSPSGLAQMLALPPVHSYLDLTFLFGGASKRSPGFSIAIGAALLLFRAALLGFLVAVLTEALGGGAQDERAAPSTVIRTGAARMLTSLPSLFVLEVAFVVVLSFLGTLLAFLGLVGLAVVLVAEMYYLVFAPVIAVTEQVRLGDAVALGLRLVRRSTRQSILFASGYVLIALFFLVLPTPFASASPSIQVWAFVLLTSFVHVGFLAAVTLRWLAVRDEVLEGWTPRGRAVRGLGLLRAPGTRAGS